MSTNSYLLHRVNIKRSYGPNKILRLATNANERLLGNLWKSQRSSLSNYIIQKNYFTCLAGDQNHILNKISMGQVVSPRQTSPFVNLSILLSEGHFDNKSRVPFRQFHSPSSFSQNIFGGDEKKGGHFAETLKSLKKETKDTEGQMAFVSDVEEEENPLIKEARERKAAFKKAQAERLAAEAEEKIDESTVKDKEEKVSDENTKSMKEGVEEEVEEEAQEKEKGKEKEEYETFSEEYPEEDKKKDDQKEKQPPFWQKMSDSILQGEDIVTASRRMGSNFIEGLRDAAQDLFGMKENQDSMKKQLYTPTSKDNDAQKEDDEAEWEGLDEETKNELRLKKEEKKDIPGGGALTIVKEGKSTWERIAETIKDAPVIQGILNASRKIGETEVGKRAGKIKEGISDKVEDAREAWETSQNPLVYRVSALWDDLTGETEAGLAIKELRRVDPDFVLEETIHRIQEDFYPKFFASYLKGDLKALKPYLTEGCYRTLAEEFRVRKSHDLVLDPNVLSVEGTDQNELKMNENQPNLLLGAIMQHINCVRKRDGDIVEGGEQEIRQSYYLLLLTRVYDEDEAALVWKVSERYLLQSSPFV